MIVWSIWLGDELLGTIEANRAHEAREKYYAKTPSLHTAWTSYDLDAFEARPCDIDD